jgi:hypothetical protein
LGDKRELTEAELANIRETLEQYGLECDPTSEEAEVLMKLIKTYTAPHKNQPMVTKSGATSKEMGSDDPEHKTVANMTHYVRLLNVASPRVKKAFQKFIEHGKSKTSS